MTISKVVERILAIIGVIVVIYVLCLGVVDLLNLKNISISWDVASTSAKVTPSIAQQPVPIATPAMNKLEDGTPPKPTPKLGETSAPTVKPVEPTTEVISNEKLGEDWLIEYFTGATSEMKAWVFPVLDPILWPMFPNVDNGRYLASQGVEYGEDLDTFCQQGQTCDFVVAARHYRLYTGDYDFVGVGSCVAKDRRGCALMVVNVGEVTAIFRDQRFDTGFTVTGRYWDGNYLSQAIWATLSHASNNMLNLNSTLNPSPINNAGANCSVPEGCLSVENTFVVISGNELLIIGRSVVAK